MAVLLDTLPQAFDTRTPVQLGGGQCQRGERRAVATSMVVVPLAPSTQLIRVNGAVAAGGDAERGRAAAVDGRQRGLRGNELGGALQGQATEGGHQADPLVARVYVRAVTVSRACARAQWAVMEL